MAFDHLKHCNNILESFDFAPYIGVFGDAAGHMGSIIVKEYPPLVDFGLVYPTD